MVTIKRIGGPVPTQYAAIRLSMSHVLLNGTAQS